ncbi:MAG: DNA polymerase I [Phycisphaerales bacterium]|nr:DNA polymerase I [Phycisphaerales bacterium]
MGRTLYIIDGYAQFFRAYHAIRTPMTSPVTKEPTNMTFGFVGMLLKLLRGEGKNLGGELKPDYLAVALDVSGDRGTFRSQIYPDYKANRPEPPEDLGPQVDRCLALLRDIGVPIIGCEGYEADDVMATLAAKLRRQHPDLRVRLISKDKDLKQLLESVEGTPRVELFDVHTEEAFTVDTLAQQTGLTPAQVVDMLTLMGDTSDNVPGVDGVGEKTAALLLKEYATLDNLLTHAAEIKGKRGEKIREAAPRLGLSKQLVTLHTDLPVDLPLESAGVASLKVENLLPVLRELGFNRYQEDVRAMLGQGAPAPAASPARPAAPTKPASADVGFGLFAEVDAARRAAEPRTAQDGVYTCVRTKEDLARVVEAMRACECAAIDTETTSLAFLDAKLCGVSVCVEPGKAWYIPVRSPQPETHLDERAVLDALGPVLADPTRPKCGHNLKYDLLVLRRHGVRLAGLEAQGSCDSMVASYLIDASRSSHGLDALSLALLSRTNISITELIGSGKNQRTFDTAPLDLATQYAAEDADVALRLRTLMMPQIGAMGMNSLMQDVEMPLVDVLAELEWNGIQVDAGELDRQRGRLEQRIEALLGKIKGEAMSAVGRGFDPDSPRQLAGILFNAPGDDSPGLGLTPTKKTKTGHSTDAEVLEALSEDPEVTTPLPGLILEYRQLTKLVSTYLVALKEAIHPETGRVHASFHQTVAATGRLASSDPNLQNIPIRTDVGREIRRAFVAPPGRVLISADYSQIELRLLAHLSHDPALIEAFAQGQDIHTAVAAQIHGVPIDQVTREQRSGAKMVNFGIVYGVTPFGLARRLKISNDAAAEIINGYKKRFSGITTFLQECIEHARRMGYVETMLKRRRPIPDADSRQPARRALAERLAINSVVQGSAADLIKLAMVDLHARLSESAPHLRGGKPAEIPGVKMVLQIHDELVFEADEAQAQPAMALIRARMEAAMQLCVPLQASASMGRTWFEGK